ncbi:universal stress protein [Sulfurirhabdus autotrophica]|nr:universal stress protein [Sulfurirhabdus autotrophica]
MASKRILLSLENSRLGDMALDAAAGLATELQAQLQGLFVEDINLLNLAGLPFAREVGHASATERRILLSDIERSLKAGAMHAQQLLAKTAERLQLQWSFKVVRGQLIADVLSMANEADLIIFGQMKTIQNESPILPLKQHIQQALVVFDGSPASQHALMTALLVARLNATTLSVLVESNTTESKNALREIATSKLTTYLSKTRFFYTQTPHLTHKIQALLKEKKGILVIGKTHHQFSYKALLQLLGSINCPVILAT